MSDSNGGYWTVPKERLTMIILTLAFGYSSVTMATTFHKVKYGKMYAIKDGPCSELFDLMCRVVNKRKNTNALTH